MWILRSFHFSSSVHWNSVRFLFSFFLFPLGPSNTMDEGNIHVSSLSVIAIRLFNAVTLM